ncbi:MAG: transcription-repair coupling factor, partial [Moraxellaceae bacterium]|nr:transcription-repair coupling factor [Moraxellaceae bacterium]
MSLPFVPELPRLAEDKRSWGQLDGCARALSLAAVTQQHPGLVVVITQDTRTATQLEEALTFFLGEDANFPLWHFPDWETLPYDQFSPHQDIISTRLQVLSQLPTAKRGILVVPITTAAHRLAPRDWLLGQAIELKRGQKLTLDDTRTQLEAAGYRAVNTVYEHGEFAV